MAKKVILLTGATGFVGGKILHTLKSVSDFKIILLTRALVDGIPPENQILLTDKNWKKSILTLTNIHYVIHCAGLAHSGLGDKVSIGKKYVEANVRLTRNLIELSVKKNSEMFIFLSSINVFGELEDKQINSSSLLDPKTWYSRSKVKCEKIIKLYSSGTDTKYLIIRPSVIYDVDGEKNSGNIQKIQAIANMLGIFCVPKSDKKRNYLNLNTLIDFICYTLENPLRKSRVVIAADSEAIGLASLVRKITKAEVKVLSVSWVFFMPLAAFSRRIRDFLTKSNVAIHIDSDWLEEMKEAKKNV